jgi:hypothetical protein
LVDQTSTCNPGAPGSSNIKARNKKDNKRRKKRGEKQNWLQGKQTNDEAGKGCWAPSRRVSKKQEDLDEVSKVQQQEVGEGRRRRVSCADVSKGFKN